MNDETQSSEPAGKSWLERLSDMFSDQPESIDDLLKILRDCTDRNVLDIDALTIIEGAIQLTKMQAREVMIPRSQMITVRADLDPEEYIQEIVESAHSRFPVFGDSDDEIEGILLAKDLLPLELKGELKRNDVLELLRPASRIPESKRLNELLKDFKRNRNHMAIVIDEYGIPSGLVTIEDVLEQIVGEIEDEHDIEEETNIKSLSETEFTVKAITTIEEFNEYFGSHVPDDHFDTIGGYAIKNFGRLPDRGDETHFEGFKVTVLNADSRTVRLLKLEKSPN